MTPSTRHTAGRQTYRHGDLRHALLEAGHRRLADRGAGGFSLREVARDVGVSPNAAYHHFADRSALLDALAAEGFTRLATRMEQGMVDAHDPVGRLAATGQGYVDFARDEPALFDVMFSTQGHAGSLGAGRGPGGLTASELLTRALDDCVAAELVEPAARRGAELLLWPAVHGLAVLGRDGVLGVDPATAFRVQFAAVLRSLGIRDVPGSAEDAPGR